MAVIGLSAVLGGCVVYLDTAILHGNKIEDPGLVGTWEGPDGVRATVTHSEGNEYSIVQTDGDGNSMAYHASLGRLGGRTVMEVFPALVPGDREAWPMARVLVVLERDGDRARLWFLDAEEAMRFAAESATPHLEVDDYLYLTVPAPILAARLEALLLRPGALVAEADDQHWRRVARAP